LTQLPLANTIDDFWQMITNERCSSVIMFDRPSALTADKVSRFFWLNINAIEEEFSADYRFLN
jgi:protein tyrosine phosphatase